VLASNKLFADDTTLPVLDRIHPPNTVGDANRDG
jgi:hypothetical protein